MKRLWWWGGAVVVVGGLGWWGWAQVQSVHPAQVSAPARASQRAPSDAAHGHSPVVSTPVLPNAPSTAPPQPAMASPAPVTLPAGASHSIAATSARSGSASTSASASQGSASSPRPHASLPGISSTASHASGSGGATTPTSSSTPPPSPVPAPSLASRVAAEPVATVAQVQAALGNPTVLGTLKMNAADVQTWWNATKANPVQLAEAAVVAGFAGNGSLFEPPAIDPTEFVPPGVSSVDWSVPATVAQVLTATYDAGDSHIGPPLIPDPGAEAEGSEWFTVTYRTTSGQVRKDVVGVSVTEFRQGWVVAGPPGPLGAE